MLSFVLATFAALESNDLTGEEAEDDEDDEDDEDLDPEEKLLLELPELPDEKLLLELPDEKLLEPDDLDLEPDEKLLPSIPPLQTRHTNNKGIHSLISFSLL